MTVNELFKQALLLLNYTDADGNVNVDVELNKRALPLVNQIYADVCSVIGNVEFTTLSSASQTIPLPPTVLTNVMPYGVAMLIAQTAGDSDNQAVYAVLYNARRSMARSTSERIQNVAPTILL